MQRKTKNIDGVTTIFAVPDAGDIIFDPITGVNAPCKEVRQDSRGEPFYVLEGVHMDLTADDYHFAIGTLKVKVQKR